MTKTDSTEQLTTHTPEPWSYDGRTTLYATPDESGEMTMIEVNANVTNDGWDTVAFIEAIWPGAHANARRIVAAVNACKGITTEALEHGIVAELLTQLVLLADHLETPSHALSEHMRALRLQEARATIAEAKGRPA